MIQLKINDRIITVKEGRTLLEACRENNIPIPTLCYHPALEPFGACRLCTVEISTGSLKANRPSRLVASCTYPCEEGLLVYTESEAVQRSRRVIAELMLASAGQASEIQALANELGVQLVRYHLPDSGAEDRCVLCGLCVRACTEIVGVSAISLIQRGIQKKVSAPFQISSTSCIGCGTCVVICPTDAILLNDISDNRVSTRVHGLSSGDRHIPVPISFASCYCQICGDMDLSITRNGADVLK